MFPGRTALLVGDDDARTRSVAGLLGDNGIVVEVATDGYLGLALAERIEAQRGALDLVIVQGRLLGMATEVFVHRLRDTSFGRRALVIWHGNEETQANVDAVIAAAADPYEVASAAQQLLAQRSPLEVLEPLAAVARGGRILVVEDDRVNQSLLVAGLSRRGFSTFVANDGDEAVRLASHDSFDAILMDIQMPHCDGFEATQKIRAMNGRATTIPIIALTGLKGCCDLQALHRSRFHRSAGEADQSRPAGSNTAPLVVRCSLCADLWCRIGAGRCWWCDRQLRGRCLADVP